MRQKTRYKTVWKSKYYVMAYQLAKSGMNDGDIARTLGISPFGWKKWVDNKPGLRFALSEGRKKEDSATQTYIYGRLSPEAKKLWDEVEAASKTHSQDAIDRLLDSKGIRVKQMLFLHFMMKSHFNPSQACKKLNISYKQYEKWIEEDYQFAEAVNEMTIHKGNFYEEKFNKLVEDEEPTVVVHAMKTFNRGRGFGDKVQIEHTGEIKNTVTLEIGEELLNRLSLPARKEVFTIMQELENEQKNGNLQKVLEYKEN